MPERATVSSRSEKSGEAVVGSAFGANEGPKEWKGEPLVIGFERSQMVASAKLADLAGRVKPEGPRQREIKSAEPE